MTFLRRKKSAPATSTDPNEERQMVTDHLSAELRARVAELRTVTDELLHLADQLEAANRRGTVRG